MKFWEYSDKVDTECFQADDMRGTLRFLWKRIFQPIERFVAKDIRDSMLRFFTKR